MVKDLSKGDFDMEDVNRMELIVLRTLLWSLNPPTPLSFVKRLINLHENLIRVFNQSLNTMLSGRGGRVEEEEENSSSGRDCRYYVEDDHENEDPRADRSERQ